MRAHGALLAVATAFACLAVSLVPMPIPGPTGARSPSRPVENPPCTASASAWRTARAFRPAGRREAARAFRALLPLRLELTDYNRTEKIADLPSRLTTRGEPDGIDPEPGDLAYYAPWGNLALFYKDFGYSRGLVRLGRLDSVPDAFRQPGR